MKHIKTFEENINDKPAIGDYAIVKIGKPGKMSNQIGKIIDIENHPYKNYFIDFDGEIWQIDATYLFRHSKNREDLEIILNSEKYNL